MSSSPTTSSSPVVDQAHSSPPQTFVTPTVATTTTTNAAALAQEMKHMTSNPDLLTPAKEARRPTKLATGQQPSGSPSRLGTRSPNDIPSSPSSIHSSSSAIFERDIEPLPISFFASTAPTNDAAHPSPNNSHSLNLNHHNANALMLESTVPAVLTSAASALADDPNNKDASMNIAVIAPACSTPQLTSPSLPQTRSMSIPVSSANSAFGGSVVGSRSPSPTRRSFSTAAHHYAPGTGSPEGPGRTASYSSTGPLPPGGFQGSPGVTRSPALSSSPSPPGLSPMAATIQLPAPVLSPGASEIYPVSPPLSPHQQATATAQSKRLSFISYNDLLNSAPVSAVSLSSMISPSTDEPPPHISAVLGTANAGGLLPAPESMGEEGGEWVGGEWEREGFGRGLEARLEDVLKQGTAPSLQMTA